MSDSQRPAPRLLPPENLAGPALSAVTMVMSFLACLALGSAILSDRAADRWLARATSAMSVQIVETRLLSAEEQLPAVMRELQATPGIAAINVLERGDLIALLEPWLGAGNIGEDLPLPLLIEITPDRQTSLSTKALQAQLKAVAPGARLDTHGRWRETLETTAFALTLFAGLVLVMVTLATATVILFATRAGLQANEEILNVLHQIGAQDGYISRRFEAHFVRTVCIAALAGLAASVGFFYALGGLVADAREGAFLLLLTPVPLAAIFLSWQVTRRYVLRRLRAQL
ncbi:MAG: cell division protein FtsX [Parvibaculales bacterium]